MKYLLEICVILGCHAACSGNSLLTFRDILSVPSSGVKIPLLLLILDCTLLGHYAARSVNSLPTFRDNQSVPSSGVKKIHKSFWMGPRGCPETSVRNSHYSLRNNPEERSSQLHRCASLKSSASFFITVNQ